MALAEVTNDKIASLEKDADRIRHAIVDNIGMIEDKFSQALEKVSRFTESGLALKETLKQNVETNPVSMLVAAMLAGLIAASYVAHERTGQTEASMHPS